MVTLHLLCCCQRSTGELQQQGQEQQVMLPLCWRLVEASRVGVQLGREGVQPQKLQLNNSSNCSRWL
jgi:hypothetical protein